MNKQFTTTITRDPSAGPSSRKINFTISTKGKDRDGDVINGPWQLDNFKKNPVVLFAHDYRSLPVGRCTSIGVVNGSLVATAQFAGADLNPLADQVYNMLCAGFLKATSVGFKPIDTPALGADGRGLIYGACELLEFSVCPVPSNPDALMRAAKSTGAEPSHAEVASAIKIISTKLDECEAGERREVEAFVRALDQLTTDELEALAVSL